MRLRHKIPLFAGIALVLCLAGVAAVYFYSMAKLKNGLTYFHGQIVQRQGDVEYLEFEYNDLGLRFPFGLGAKQFQVDIITSGTNQRVRLTAESVMGQLKGIPSGALRVSAKNLQLLSADPEKPLLSNQYKIRSIDIQYVDYVTYVSVLSPDQSMRRVYNNLAELLERGDTTGRLNMQGTVYFDFGDELVILQRFSTQTNENLTRIVLDRRDLNQVAPKFASRLSEGDLDLVANHPMKAPRLIEIRRETEERSRELRWSQQDVPEDVYRHVLWSYLLAKEYGPEFAHLITNAHEVGSFNTEEEMAKDRQNNRIGITYAENNVPEARLLDRIRNDPRIQH